MSNIWRRVSDIFQVNYLLIFFVLAVLTVGGLLWYSNQLVSKLAKNEENLVNFWADVYQFIATSTADNAESSFLINKIIINQKQKIIDVPAIVVDENGNPNTHNLRLPENISKEKENELVLKELERMKNSGYEPIKFSYMPGAYHYVYYRETDELVSLRYFPYITVFMMLVFILILFANFYVAQKSQQNKVWVGLARETAHQLGTPISGLMAWIELLRLKVQTPEDQTIVEELEKDVRHLEIIAERFSKIGSEPELTDYPIARILEGAMKYVRDRASRAGKVNISFINELPHDFKLRLSPTLLEWVIENLLKNALDALAGRTMGTIELRVCIKGDYVQIDVEDNGKGIARRDLKKVFRPGFTTKKRGWGLGLSLSRRVIENFHGGKIFVRRSEPDKGTTFRILLPIEPQEITPEPTRILARP